jgi:hypothetical protein
MYETVDSVPDTLGTVNNKPFLFIVQAIGTLTVVPEEACSSVSLRKQASVQYNEPPLVTPKF